MSLPHPSPFRFTPLDRAVELGHAAISAFLKRKGAKTKHELDAIRDVAVNEGCSLWDAAKDGDLLLVQALVKAGKEVDGRDEHGQTGLWWAARKGEDALCRYLVGQGASVNKGNKRGNTPMHIAGRNGHLACLKICVRHGCGNYDIENEDGENVLAHTESSKKRPKGVQDVLQFFEDEKDHVGWGPVSVD